jgi:hypothetical protein
MLMTFCRCLKNTVMSATSTSHWSEAAAVPAALLSSGSSFSLFVLKKRFNIWGRLDPVRFDRNQIQFRVQIQSKTS